MHSLRKNDCMGKIFGLLLCTIMVMSSWAIITPMVNADPGDDDLEIEFIEPTPCLLGTNPYYGQDVVTVNVSTDGTGNKTALLDWDRSLVGYWSMDCFGILKSLPTVIDQSTYGNDGYNINSTLQIKEGKFGPAFQFDGQDTYLSIPDDPSLQPGTSDFTVEAWFKTDDTTGTRTGLVQKHRVDHASDCFVLDFVPNNGTVRWHLADQSSGSTDYDLYSDEINPLNDNMWHHVVAMRGENHMYLYIDGILSTSMDCTGLGSIEPDQSLYLGSKGNGNPAPHNVFDGSIDEVRFWKRAISEQEILASYDNTANQLSAVFENLADCSTHTYMAMVQNETGTFNETILESAIIDTIAPTITIKVGEPVMEDVYDLDGDLIDRINGSTPIYLNVSDGCGIIDHYDWAVYCEGSLVAEGVNNSDIVIYCTENCLHEIDVECYDSAGNCKFEYLHVLVDIDAPDVVVSSFGTPYYFDGSSLFINDSTEVTLTCEDRPSQSYCASGIKEIRHTIDSGGEFVGNIFTLSGYAEGCHTLEYYALDNLGQEGMHTSKTVCLDNTGPSMVYEYSQLNCFNREVLFNGSSITISAIDNPSPHCVGVEKILYQIDGGSTESVSGETAQMQFTTVGNHTINCWAEDNLGNVGVNKSIDLFIAEVSVQLEIGEPQHIVGGTTFIDSTTMIWINASDINDGCTNSMVERIVFNISNATGVTGPHAFSGNSTTFCIADYSLDACYHMIEYWTEDHLGNQCPHQTTEFYVDEEVPTQSDEFIGPEVQINNITYVGPTTLCHIETTDQGCGLGGAGVCYLNWKINNKDGLIASGRVEDGQTTAYGDGVVIVSSDLDSQVGSITCEIKILESCEHFIYYSAVDCLGNEAIEQKVHFKVDATLPYVVLTDPMSFSDPFIRCSDPATITGNDDDSECSSGVKSLNWTITKNDNQDSSVMVNGIEGNTGQFSFVGGIHTVEYWAIDTIGNEGIHQSKTYHVDCSPPSVYVRIEGDNHTVGDATWLTSESIINISAIEYRNLPLCKSGLVKLDVFINGIRVDTNTTLNESWYEFDLDCLECCPCGINVSWCATDAVGNVKEGYRIINIDDQAPDLQIDLHSPFIDFYDLLSGYHKVITTEWNITASAEDLPSCGVGVESIQYRYMIAGSAWTEWSDYHEPISFVLCGDYLVEFHATDYLGHETTWNGTFILNTCDGGTSGPWTVLPYGDWWLIVWGSEYPITPIQEALDPIDGYYDIVFHEVSSSWQSYLVGSSVNQFDTVGPGQYWVHVDGIDQPPQDWGQNAEG